MKAGDIIDVRDTEYIWCKATVEFVITSGLRSPLLYIHYEGWNRRYDEYIFMNSQRLCPLGTYSSRQDIPRYVLNSNQNVMYGTVVERGDQIRQIQE